MDDLHQKTRDADKNTDKSRDSSSTHGHQGSGERHTPSETAPQTAAPPSGNSGTGDTLQSLEAKAGEAADQVTSIVRNVGEQAWSAASNAGGTAQQMMRQARDQVSDVVKGSGSRAGDFLSQNVNEYPLPALLIAGAIGYGIGYLLHNSWQSQDGQGSQRATRSGSDNKR